MGAQPSDRRRVSVLYIRVVLRILLVVVIINDGRHDTLEI